MLLERLVEVQFLTRTRDGAFLRPDVRKRLSTLRAQVPARGRRRSAVDGPEALEGQMAVVLLQETQEPFVVARRRIEQRAAPIAPASLIQPNLNDASHVVAHQVARHERRVADVRTILSLSSRSSTAAAGLMRPAARRHRGGGLLVAAFTAAMTSFGRCSG